MLTDFLIRILIGIGVAVLAGIITSLLRIKYRLLISIICFIVAIILSFLIKPLPTTVPYVIGYFEADAERIIREAGLLPAKTYQSGSSENEDKVIQQKPKGGVRVAKNTPVILTIGIGNEVAPLPRIDTNNGNENININFIRPQNGAHVPQFSDVEYQIRGSIPSGYRDVLFVQDPLGQYWSWGTPAGRMRTIQFGVEEDGGKQFRIIVLITDREIPFGRKYQDLPSNIQHSSITVIRQ